ncbi:hypothetical protein Pla144_23810 [Bythopirellula polymerisocia]|uniref:Uncharacterized protein n=1 Tax=Bythopirellula polymerisocia TaxID=2528003 RepID=A0A5C6CVB6_9BACT|nr:hypothetical protein Pla144_23810 [Bythopirellula polymerisocia]
MTPASLAGFNPQTRFVNFTAGSIQSFEEKIFPRSSTSGTPVTNPASALPVYSTILRQLLIFQYGGKFRGENCQSASISAIQPPPPHFAPLASFAASDWGTGVDFDGYAFV